MDETQLAALAERAKGGDHLAFRDLVIACQQSVRASLLWHAPSVEVAEDVLQATFVTAWEKLSTWRGDGSLTAWLKQIARNHLSDELVARRRHRQFTDDLLEQVAAAGPGPELSDGVDEAHLAALRDCLGELAPRARLMIERRYLHGIDLAVLARQFKQRSNTVAVTLMRIRACLRDCLAGKGASP